MLRPAVLFPVVGVGPAGLPCGVAAGSLREVRVAAATCVAPPRRRACWWWWWWLVRLAGAGAGGGATEGVLGAGVKTPSRSVPWLVMAATMAVVYLLGGIADMLQPPHAPFQSVVQLRGKLLTLWSDDDGALASFPS